MSAIYLPPLGDKTNTHSNLLSLYGQIPVLHSLAWCGLDVSLSVAAVGGSQDRYYYYIIALCLWFYVFVIFCEWEVTYNINGWFRVMITHIIYIVLLIFVTYNICINRSLDITIWRVAGKDRGHHVCRWHQGTRNTDGKYSTVYKDCITMLIISLEGDFTWAIYFRDWWGRSPSITNCMLPLGDKRGDYH